MIIKSVNVQNFTRERITNSTVANYVIKKTIKISKETTIG